MLKKTRSAETGKSRVTFVLSSQPKADHIHVAGDFNDWQASTPMKRQKDGSWRATVQLEPGREYQFRYLVDGNNWVNDDAADAYVPNPFGADNSVVRTPEAAGAGSGSGGAAAGGRSSKGTTARAAGAKGTGGRSTGSAKRGAGAAAPGGKGKRAGASAESDRSGGSRAGKAGSRAGAKAAGEAGAARQNGSRKVGGGAGTRAARSKTREE